MSIDMDAADATDMTVSAADAAVMETVTAVAEETADATKS
jgi:hypothetical protein